jgi:hypothetical protein
MTDTLNTANYNKNKTKTPSGQGKHRALTAGIYAGVVGWEGRGPTINKEHIGLPAASLGDC